MGKTLVIVVLVTGGTLGLLACFAATVFAGFVMLAVGEFVLFLVLLATAAVYVIRHRVPTPVSKPSSLRLNGNMKTALFTFADDKARDKFFRLLKTHSDNLIQPTDVLTSGPEETAAAIANGHVIKDALKTVKLDPPLKADHERIVALFVSGRKMREGSMAELNKQFLQEVESHKASVELKELRDGEWVSIRSRKLQRQ